MRDEIIELISVYKGEGPALLADDILAIVNKPIEVRLKCERCEGHVHEFKCSGQTQVAHCECGKSVYTQDMHKTSCTCDNGEKVHMVMWEWPLREIAMLPESKPLTPTDLVDPDVAMAYCEIHENIRLNHSQDEDIPHNKGTLRLQEIA
jgi:hypothetical protein